MYTPQGWSVVCIFGTFFKYARSTHYQIWGGVVPHFLPIIGKCQMVPGTILGGGVKSARKGQKTI